jgi:predicted phosphodiesterase
MRILVISDIHANLTAFDAVLEDAKGEWDYVWCLGDVVGYGPDPNECVERLRELPHLCLAGNHDWAALGRLDIRTFNPHARIAVEWTMAALKPENRAYLEDLPVTLVLGDYTLVHASPREPIWEYILEPLVAALNFPHFDTPYCFVGHTHQPVIYELVGDDGDNRAREPLYHQPITLEGKKQIINPGSVGQPRDQNPDAAYGLLNLDTNVFEHRRVPYDIPPVQARMQAREANLRERLRKLEHDWYGHDL